MSELPSYVWDRFSGSHFAGMNDHDSLAAALEVLRERLRREFERVDLEPDRVEIALNAAFETKVKADA